MNEIISDKNLINQMYVDYSNGKTTYKYGIIRIMDFQNIIYASDKDQNIILNLLAEKNIKINLYNCISFLLFLESIALLNLIFL